MLVGGWWQVVGDRHSRAQASGVPQSEHYGAGLALLYASEASLVGASDLTLLSLLRAEGLPGASPASATVASPATKLPHTYAQATLLPPPTPAALNPQPSAPNPPADPNPRLKIRQQ